MDRLPLTALRAFGAVHRTGGIRAAARLLGVTHSSVSRQIRDLEAWLGSSLLEDYGRGKLKLTAEGEKLGAAALAALDDMERAVRSIQERKKPSCVTLATTASIAARWLLPALDDLRQRHPSIEISIITEQRLADPDGNEVDLAIRMGPGPYPGCKAEPLSGDALLPVVSADLFRSLAEDHAAALQRLPLLHDRDPHASWASWLSVHPVEGLDPRSGSRFTSSDLVLDAATAGFGCALARRFLAEQDLAEGKLVALFGGTRTLRLPNAYWLVKPNLGHTRPTVALVEDWLRDQVRRRTLPVRGSEAF
jgi:LysR family glycine cleavage system transcriptional activator